MTIIQTIIRAMRDLVQPRRTVPLPSILTPMSAAAQPMPKPTPQNLRKFAETPIARRAINIVKDRVAGMAWRIQPKNGRAPNDIPNAAERIRLLTDNLDTPNPQDSFRSLAEQVLEDVIVGGFGAIEMQLADDPAHPLTLWPVDGASIRLKPDWDGKPDTIRYAQSTGEFGAGFASSGISATIALRDDELSYIRLNPRTHTPFGLGRLEVAFETINAFLGANRYAARLASNSVVQYALWLNDVTPVQHERLIRWWQDDIEGTGRVPLLSLPNKPEVLRFAGGTDADLHLAWQDFLLRIIAAAFDLPPFMLGLESDVNRATAAVNVDHAFRNSIVPTARLFAEHITRDVIAKKLGWHDLEFVFTDTDAQDELQSAQIHEILLRNGVLTVNEVRAQRGMAPLEQATG